MGDAAHQMPPFLGQGACTGFRDAMNLAWKLQLVTQGLVPATLLASYEVERRPHVHTIMRQVISFGSVIQTTNRLQAWLRDRVLRLRALMGRSTVSAPDIIPPLTDGILAAAPTRTSKRQDRKAAGRRGYPFPQRPVTLPDERVVPLDDALGLGFALVGYACDPLQVLAPDLLTRFTDLGGRVIQILPAQTSTDPPRPDGVRDHTGALGEWFASHAMQVALVRPDRYLFGGGTLAQSPALTQQLLDRLLVHAPTAV